MRVNGWAVDFWVLGVLAWLMFFFFVWSVVWSTCCLLGVLLCKWVMQHLESPPQLRAETSRSSPRSRSGPHRPLLGQLPRRLRAIPSLKTCPHGKRYMPRPTQSGGRVSARRQRPPAGLARIDRMTADVAGAAWQYSRGAGMRLSLLWRSWERMSRQK
ncbi:MAG TPA: hypothetical protein VFA63_11865 [Pseudonocardiaceae bacterium]|nr:hypothetical protein [Pseudonocardiaceae bacterium]